MIEVMPDMTPAEYLWIKVYVDSKKNGQDNFTARENADIAVEKFNEKFAKRGG